MSVTINGYAQAVVYNQEQAGYARTGKEKIDSFYDGLSSAVEKSTGKPLGEPLALTMLPYDESRSYGMVASYSDATSEDDPIIRVSSNWGGEKRVYDVHVNEVNPRNATGLEMFALMAYQDDQGITDGGTFGSYQKMKVFAANAQDSGYCSGIYEYDSFLNKKMDWISIIQKMMSDYMCNHLTYGQGLDCQKLITGMEKAEKRYQEALTDMELTVDDLKEIVARKKETGEIKTVSGEEFLREMDALVQKDLDRNYKSTREALIEVDPTAIYQKYRFGDEARIYDFDEYVRELDRRLAELNAGSRGADSFSNMADRILRQRM